MASSRVRYLHALGASGNFLPGNGTLAHPVSILQPVIPGHFLRSTRTLGWPGFPWPGLCCGMDSFCRTPGYDLRRRPRSATRSLAPTPAVRKVFKAAWGPKELSVETNFKFSHCLGDADVSVTIAPKPCLTPALELKGAGPLTQIIVGFVLLLSSCLS